MMLRRLMPLSNRAPAPPWKAVGRAVCSSATDKLWPAVRCSVTVIEFPDVAAVAGTAGIDAPEAMALSAGVVRCANYTAHLGAAPPVAGAWCAVSPCFLRMSLVLACLPASKQV